MVANHYNIPVNSPYKKQYMKQLVLAGLLGLAILNVDAQTPKTYTSSELLQQLKKLNVLGSVLYVAAHPDDENTRLMTYLANEKLYRTGYLSLTRGDGGQNLIGDDQGIDLGLIRTQELLAARRVDGAEQFFSRAYDFGYSKSPEEAMRIWGHDEILSDVVWVIRKFRPDVIICRFPTTGEGGHGHHTASAILAEEAYDAAADTTRFPEQFKHGVGTWRATRLLWNTFNFGGANTQRADQFKLDVGLFNPLLGKSYGEIAAQSRSQHKSQGFGVPAQRGTILEYFKTLKGTPPVNDLMDGVNTGWSRLSYLPNAAAYTKTIDSLIAVFDHRQPGNIALPLAKLVGQWSPFRPNLNYGAGATNDFHYINQKSVSAFELIAASLGIFAEATATNQLNVRGDTMRLNLTLNIRNSSLVSKVAGNVTDNFMGKEVVFDSISPNTSYTKPINLSIGTLSGVSNPYWITNGLQGGRFHVTLQNLIGLPEDNKWMASFRFDLGNNTIFLSRPIQYKYTDPVKGELYQPLQVVSEVFLKASPSLVLFNTNNKKEQKKITIEAQFNTKIQDTVHILFYEGNGALANRTNTFAKVADPLLNVAKGDKKRFELTLSGPKSAHSGTTTLIHPSVETPSLLSPQKMSFRKISYDHIPDIYYPYVDAVKLVNVDLKTVGTHVGYIVGAGDKVPEALEQMGYKVTLLKQNDIVPGNLKQFDAIVTGVRAYNTNEWMNDAYEVLMDYVREGGTMLVQYNTSNQIGPIKAKISPYPFNISRNRITDETAAVTFLQPDHDALNYPNKITTADFEGWIQERSIYHADKIDSNYKAILSMADPGEKPDNGSLIVSNYGKGKFVYTGLVFFRELPAGVPGAYRLLANLISPRRKYNK
jgi:LmbE family N-acetylglucosaminyl deacetylase